MFNRVLIAALLTLAMPAAAHDWYPMECCSQQDCGEAEIVKMVPEGRIVRQISTGLEVLVPINSPKIRPNLHDDKYHVCIRTAGKDLLCFFEPSGS